MRILILFLIAFTFAPAYPYSPKKLSGAARISLITCAPGDELYSIFGHSAIRVLDDSLHINEVYNYGTFDFDTPNFYLKFANGKLNYMLSAYNFRYFLPAYSRERRGVTEQVLNLTAGEKQKLYNALEINRRPENKFYRYDFFFDNCATRIRDIVFSAIDSKIEYTGKDTIDMSFRDMLHLYLDKQPWVRDGIDIILGSKIDRKVTVWESMFLPDYLEHYFMNVNIISDGRARPLVANDTTLLEFDAVDTGTFRFAPEFAAWALFFALVLATIIERRAKKRIVTIDRLLLLATGVIGIIVFYLWFLTEHSATGSNYNILWAMPTNMILLFYLKNAVKIRLIRYLGFVTWAALFVALAGWKFLPQDLPASAFPITLIMFIRLWRYFF